MIARIDSIAIESSARTNKMMAANIQKERETSSCHRIPIANFMSIGAPAIDTWQHPRSEKTTSMHIGNVGNGPEQLLPPQTNKGPTMDSPIAGVSDVSDEEGLREFMNESEDEAQETARPKEKINQDSKAISCKPPSIDSADVTPCKMKEPPASPSPLIVETTKRRSPPSEEAIIPVVKKTKYGCFDQLADSPSYSLESMTITASDGSIIVFPKIPMKDLPAAPVSSREKRH
jgi:hypothetical protein